MVAEVLAVLGTIIIVAVVLVSLCGCCGQMLNNMHMTGNIFDNGRGRCY